jgi:hypothetical protein
MQGLWICASLIDAPSAGSLIVCVPIRLPCPMVWPLTPYSPSWIDQLARKHVVEEAVQL